MSQCSKCKTENPAGNKFCMECGEPLTSKNKVCQACHSSIPATAKICPHCRADQSVGYLTFNNSEFAYLQMLFQAALVDTKIKQQHRTIFTIREEEELNARIGDKFPNEQIIVWIPAQQYEVLRETSALHKITLNGSERRGELVITNHRFIFISGDGKKVNNLFVAYANITAYQREGVKTFKKFFLEFTTQAGNKAVFHFVTPARGATNTLMSILSSNTSADEDRRDKAGDNFGKAFDELTAIISKRWK